MALLSVCPSRFLLELAAQKKKSIRGEKILRSLARLGVHTRLLARLGAAKRG
jgi:hypothetical protein